MALSFTPQDIGSGYQSTESLNENFDNIQTALADGLSRSGQSPNAMGADLDMQGNRIYNLPNAVSNGEPVTYAQWAAGQTITEFSGYLQEVQTATAAQTVFTLTNPYTPGLGGLRVFVNGLYIPPSDYVETDVDTVTFTLALEEDDEVAFIITSFSAADYDTAATVQFLQQDNTYTTVQAKINSMEMFKLPVTVATSPYTPDVDSYHVFDLTVPNTGLTIAAPTGTVLDGEEIEFLLQQNATGGGSLTWNAVFCTDLSNTSNTANKYASVTFRWSEGRSQWIQTGKLEWTA